MKRKMSNKSTIFAALLCLSWVNPANAASVWSSELLFDGLSNDWQLHVVSDDDDLFNPANITGVYLDNVVDSQINPIDLLTSSLADVASSDPYDFFSNSQIDSLMEAGGPGEIVIKQLDTSGLNGLGQLPDLTCRQFSCTTWLRHQDGAIRQVLSMPGSPAPQMTLTQSALSPIPVPAAVWLFGTGLLGLVGVARRK